MPTTNGLLLVDKPRGRTSHDVVAAVRKLMDERRVGHAGTLDPLATGLLVLAVGPSTRLLRFAQSEVKRYCGTVRLGVATDSLDADGVVVDERPVPPLSQDQMDLATSNFVGARLQVPPMVSAIQIGGQRLHELARQGIEVARSAREVTISSFRVTPGEDPADWHFAVECSVGTYVRVLLSDLAHDLGTVGHLTTLRRVASGHFRVEDALTLEELADALASNATVLAPPSAFVEHLERIVLSDDDERRVRLGQRLARDEVLAAPEIAALNSAAQLVAVLRRRGDLWQPTVVLPFEPRTARG